MKVIQMENEDLGHDMDEIVKNFRKLGLESVDENERNYYKIPFITTAVKEFIKNLSVNSKRIGDVINWIQKRMKFVTPSAVSHLKSIKENLEKVKGSMDNVIHGVNKKNDKLVSDFKEESNDNHSNQNRIEMINNLIEKLQDKSFSETTDKTVLKIKSLIALSSKVQFVKSYDDLKLKPLKPIKLDNSYTKAMRRVQSV